MAEKKMQIITRPGDVKEIAFYHKATKTVYFVEVSNGLIGDYKLDKLMDKFLNQGTNWNKSTFTALCDQIPAFKRYGRNSKKL